MIKEETPAQAYPTARFHTGQQASNATASYAIDTNSSPQEIAATTLEYRFRERYSLSSQWRQAGEEFHITQARTLLTQDRSEGQVRGQRFESEPRFQPNKSIYLYLELRRRRTYSFRAKLVRLRGGHYKAGSGPKFCRALGGAGGQG